MSRSRPGEGTTDQRISVTSGSASFVQSLEIGSKFQTFEALDAIRGTGRRSLFVLSDRPGCYWIDDVWVE